PHGPHPTTEDPGNPQSAPHAPRAPPAATAAADQTPGTHAHTSGGNTARSTRTHPGNEPSATPTSVSRSTYTASRPRPPREHLEQLPDHRGTLSGNRRIRAPAADEGAYRDQVTGRRRRIRHQPRQPGQYLFPCHPVLGGLDDDTGHVPLVPVGADSGSEGC